MNRTRVTAPSGDVVTLAEVKAHLRIDTSDEDAYLTSLTAAAVDYVENITSRFLLSQTWDVFFDRFPSGDLFVERMAPSTALVQVRYFDSADVEQTMSTDDYHVDLLGDRVRVEPDSAWPSTKDKPNAVAVRVTAGYADAAAIPDQLKHAVLFTVGWLDAARHAETEAPAAIAALVGPYRTFVV